MTLKALYGVAGLGPVQLTRYLTRVNGGCAMVVNNHVHRTGPLPQVPSIVFANLSQFLKHSQRITKDHIAFVVDAPEKLDMVNGLLGLGYTRSKAGWYSYTPLRDAELRSCLTEAAATSSVKWNYVPRNPIKELIHDDKSDAALNKLRSVLYSVANKELRSTLTSAVYSYLTSGWSIARLESAIQGSSIKVQARISAIVKTDECQALKTAFQEYVRRPSAAHKICKAHKVSMFTLRYLETKTKKSKVVGKQVRH